MNQTLSACENELTRLLESLPIATNLLALDGRVLWANQAELDMLGYDREEYVGRHLTEFVAEQEVASDILRRFGNGEPLHQYETALRHKNGSLRRVLISSAPPSESDGTATIRCFTRDITLRRQAQEILWDSEERFRAAFNQAAVGMALLSLDGKMLQVNPRLAALIGGNVNRLHGRQVAELVHPEGREHVQRQFGALAVAARSDFTVETRFNRDGGSSIWVNLTVGLLRDVNDRPQRLLAVFEDVNEQRLHALALQEHVNQLRQTEAALRESEALLRAVVNTAVDGIITIDEIGTVRTVNPAVERIFGYTAAELIGRNVRILMPSPYRDQHDAYLSAYLRTGERKIIGIGREVRGVRKDGAGFPLDLSVSETRLGGRRVFTGIVRDITQRKRAEDALRESESRFRMMADGAPVMIWLSGTDAACTFFNKPWLDFTGRTMEQELGNGWAEGVHPDDMQQCVDLYLRSFETRRSFTLECRLRRRDGQYRWVLDNGVPLTAPDGTFMGYIGSCIDITERRAAEEQMRRMNEELEQRVTDRTAQLVEANRELESFSYSVSHDLRAPLRHIIGYSDLLRTRGADALDGPARRYVQTIADVARQAGQMIDDLLSFSRMGRAEMTWKAVETRPLIEQAKAHLEWETRDRKIEWSFGELPVVQGDPAMLQLVFQNLLSNALKFTRDIEDPHIEVGSRLDDHEVVFFVRDNGAGFDMRYADKLFGVFQRLHAVDEFPGSGIGLANVRRIVHRHGGRTWAQGAPGAGATFYFSIPVRREEELAW